MGARNILEHLSRAVANNMNEIFAHIFDAVSSFYYRTLNTISYNTTQGSSLHCYTEPPTNYMHHSRWGLPHTLSILRNTRRNAGINKRVIVI